MRVTARAWLRLFLPLAGISLLAACQAHDAPRGSDIASELRLAIADEATDSFSRLHAYVFVSEEDCNGNWHVADYFGSPGDSSSIPLAAFFLVGSEAFLPQAKSLLGKKGLHRPILSASPRLLSALSAVGRMKTPFVILVDGSGEVRYASSSPLTVDGTLAWRRLLPLMKRMSETERAY